MLSAIVVADLHMDVGRAGRSGPGRINSAWQLAHQAWLHACQTAIDKKVDIMLVAGDVFHTGHPRPEAIQMFADGLIKLSEANIPTLIVGGNHEQLNWPRQHRHVLLQFAHIPLVTVVLEPKVFRTADIEIACLPWPDRSQLVAALDLAQVTAGEQHQRVSNWLAEQVKAFADDMHADTSKLLLGHAMVMSSDLHLGSEVVQGVAPLVLPSNIPHPLLAPTQFEGPWPLSVLGHVHLNQWLSKNVMYAGCPWRIDFSEAGLRKGPSLITWDAKGRTKIELLDGPDRNLVVFDIYPETDIRALDKVDFTEATVRLQLHDISPADSIEFSKIIQERGGWIYDRKTIKTPTDKSITAAKHVLSTDVSPMQALDKWADINSLDPSQKGALLRQAELIISSL